MPKKTFNPGDVLAASDVNTYLMNQAVMTFAGTAARSSAIGTASEGMLTWLEDSNVYQYWNGTAWVGLVTGTNATVTTGTTAYTATAANANGFIYSTSASAVTVTIPDVLNVGESIDIIRDGAGTVIIAAGTGVTSWAGLATSGTATTFKIDQQYNAATVIEVAAQTYRVIGKISL
jgi:hypothetical protein